MAFTEGWYQDPTGSAEQRWWDGTAWTDHTHGEPPPQAIVPPPPPASAPPGHSGPPEEFSDEVIQAARAQGKEPAEPNGGGWRTIFVIVAPAGIIALFVLFHLSATSGDNDGGPAWLRYVAAGAGLAGAAGAVFYWQRYWRVLDTPTLDMEGLRPGHVELAGTIAAVRGDVFEAPVTGVPCVAAKVRLEREVKKKDDESSWVLVFEAAYAPVVPGVTDGTHVVTLDQWEQKLMRETVQTTVRTDNRHALRSYRVAGVGVGGRNDKNNFRVSEEAALVGDPVLIHALVVPGDDGLEVAPPARQDGAFVEHGGVDQVLGRLRRIAMTWTTTAAALLLIAASTEGEPVNDHQALVFSPDVVRIGLLVGGALALAATITYAIRLYNRLRGAHQQSLAAWSWIAVEMQTRHDLIPDLASAVAGSYQHERSAQVDTVVARLHKGSLPPSDQLADIETAAVQDHRAAKDLVALSEAYPELRTKENVDHLFAELVRVENRIAAARRFYNNAVTVHRNLVTTMPGVMLASLTPDAGAHLDLDLGDGSVPVASS